MLKQRLLTALVLLLLIAWVLLTQGNLGWSLFLGLAGLLATDEWIRLDRAGPARRLAHGLLSAMLVAACLAGLPAHAALAHGLLVLAAVFWGGLVPLWLLRGWALPAGPATALAGWLAILPCLVALQQLRARGLDILLCAMAVIWVSDISAYFSGRRFGRHRLAPAISPGKTWEGVAGALCGVLLLGVLVARLAPASGDLAAVVRRAGPAWLPLLTLLALLGIEGDLLESWLKRCAGVKDSGTLLPGHGGVLDRIDALLPALPVAALLLQGSAPGARA